MVKYVIKRVLLFIPVLLGILFIIFCLKQITPGDPVIAVIGTNYTEEQYAATQQMLGLDKPFLVQFFTYVYNIVTKFDFGNSYTTMRAVSDEIMDRFLVTMELGLIGVFITVIIGVPLGMVSATRQYTALDYSVTVGSLIFAAMPSFWLAMMMIIVFSLRLKWVPATGLDTWQSWILPSLALGLSPVASVTRMTRSSMLEVIRQDYIRTARAKGLSERKVIRRHALKNALIPVVTVIGIQLGMIFGGSVIVETIFTIPGLGTLMMTAINNRDYPVIMGCVLFLSVSICTMNLVVDLVYGFLDPRIRAQYSGGKRKKKSTAPAQEVTA